MAISRWRRVVWAAVFVLVWAAAGCSTPSAPGAAPTAAGGTATLRAGGFYLHYGFGGYVHILIDTVDGQPGPRAALSLGSTTLEAGERVVVATATGMSLRTPVRAEFRFTAQPGHDYRLRGAADKSGGAPRLWLEDASTGSQVAGVAPAPPAPSGVRVITLDQAMRATPAQLAVGYLVVGLNLAAARTAERPGSSVVTRIDGTEQRIDASNAAAFVAGFDQRLRTYAEAVQRRGFVQVAGNYRGSGSEGCRRLGLGDGATTIRQDGFELTLETPLPGTTLKHRGVVVESTAAFELATNSDLRLVGEMVGGRLALASQPTGCTYTLVRE